MGICLQTIADNKTGILLPGESGEKANLSNHTDDYKASISLGWRERKLPLEYAIKPVKISEVIRK